MLQTRTEIDTWTGAGSLPSISACVRVEGETRLQYATGLARVEPARRATVDTA